MVWMLTVWLFQKRQSARAIVMKRFHARGRGRRFTRREKSQQHDHRGQRKSREELIHMGQKINPIGLRVGINRTWDSRWYAGRDYAKKLIEDLKLREYVQEHLKAAGISKVIVERAAKNTKVTVHTARPGVIIGKKGADIDKAPRQISLSAWWRCWSLNIVEVRKPEIDAQLVG
jgi:hypothetical protein